MKRKRHNKPGAGAPNRVGDGAHTTIKFRCDDLTLRYLRRLEAQRSEGLSATIRQAIIAQAVRQKLTGDKNDPF